jgi:uncharacterized protein YbjT (DUF2867 family)
MSGGAPTSHDRVVIVNARVDAAEPARVEADAVVNGALARCIVRADHDAGDAEVVAVDRGSATVPLVSSSRDAFPASLVNGPTLLTEVNMKARTILLTGATGFVGRALRPALVTAGWQTRCLTRDASAARRRWPAGEWVEGDLADAGTAERVLAGCDAAVYLVHSMGDGAGFHQREVDAARRFAAAAATAGVGRIVYFGGVAPSGKGSEHLRSRVEVGEALRGGTVPTIELRASMIIGHGSLSWLIVRDLAARLPVMVLPRWLKSRTEPVAIDDIVVALARALELPLDGSVVFHVPGPEVMSGRDILAATARVMSNPKPDNSAQLAA